VKQSDNHSSWRTAILDTVAEMRQGVIAFVAVSVCVIQTAMGNPQIANVQFSGSPGNYTLTVNGSGFGTLPSSLPFDGDTSYFRVADAAQLGFGEWGYAGDANNLTYESWSDTEIQVSGFGGQPGDAVALAVWNPSSGVGATWGGSVPGGSGTPQITSVTFSGSGQNLQITVQGSGFGNAPVTMPFTGNLDYFGFGDFQSHCGAGSALFGAGFGGWGVVSASSVTLNYQSWSDTQIVINGFAGSYGEGCAILQDGDPVVINVWNTSDTGFTGLQTAWGGFAAEAVGQDIYVIDSSGNLGTVDVSSCAATVIGNMGVVLTDIAFSPNGDLYGLSYTDLYRIDPDTAAVTLIGPHGIDGGNALKFATNGTLYAAGNATTLLYTINPSTGAASPVGNIGFASAGDLAFNSGQLFMTSTDNQLIQIDLTNGAAGTAIGPLGFENVFGLATGDDGVLYGVSGTQLLSVNISTAAGTLVCDYSGQGLGPAYGAAFITEAVPATNGTGVCSYALSVNNGAFGAAGGSDSVSVTASNGCTWTAISNDPFIAITSATNGTGNASVSYSVAANSGAARTGTMTIAGQTFTVDQTAATPVTFSFTHVVQTCKTKTKIDKRTETTNTTTTCTVAFNLVVSNPGVTETPKFSVLLWLEQGSAFSPNVGVAPLAEKVKALRGDKTATIKVKAKVVGDQAGTFIFATDTDTNVLAFVEVPSPE